MGRRCRAAGRACDPLALAGGIGRVAERLNAAVSKTVSGVKPLTGVRIPPLPFSALLAELWPGGRLQTLRTRTSPRRWLTATPPDRPNRSQAPPHNQGLDIRVLLCVRCFYWHQQVPQRHKIRYGSVVVIDVNRV
jgi:hypothetical protein